MAEITIYSGSIGVNNKVTPHRLPFGRGGVSALEQSENVLIDISGEIVSRKGSINVSSGSFHSTFPAPGGFYVVRDGADASSLFRAVIDADGSVDLNGIRSGMARRKVDYANIGEKTFYCNGVDNGALTFDHSALWPTNEWTGQETTADMVATPTGEHLDVLSGRLILSVGDELFFTEYGLPGLIDNVRNRRRLESRIIMIASVQTGVYVSDEKAVYFLAGTNPHEWNVRKVLNYPAVEWGRNHDLINPSYFGIETTELSCLFATSRGPVVGLPDGIALNLIEDNVSTAKCTTGCCMVVDETMILQS